MISSRTVTAAILWIASGAALRLYGLEAMEFKADEQKALALGTQLLADRPWATDAPWPTHGMMSSNGIANAPLFTWVVAVFWTIRQHPVGVAALIALSNAAALVPLWFWARRRFDDNRALLVLAIVAVSPFAVLLSRKIWTQDLLFPGLVITLWGIEWLRHQRPWLGVAALGLGVLLVGQLHQSGLIAMALLPIAIAVQLVVDRQRGRTIRFGRPSLLEGLAVVIAIGLNAFFWLPYVTYLITDSRELFAYRAVSESFTPDLLIALALQVAPLDLLRFFMFDRGEFRADIVRWSLFYGAGAAGAPLFAYGLWRWARAPLTVPVAGVWWWLVIAVFTLGRIQTHFFYTVALAPLAALLPAGGFDPDQTTKIHRVLPLWRWTYVGLLLSLSVITVTWLTDRGGAGGDYGVAYRIRETQAKALVAASRGEPFAASESGLLEAREPIALNCAAPPPEVAWLAGWIDNRASIGGFFLCDEWVVAGHDRVYRWNIQQAR